MIARFAGGPLDGKEMDLPMMWLTIEISDAIKDEVAVLDAVQRAKKPPLGVPAFAIELSSGDDAPRTRYVLGQVDDRKSIAHYYVPSTIGGAHGQ